MAALLMLMGCVKPDTTDDAGTDDDAGVTEYTGPATSNVIPVFDPDFDAGGNQLIDAGNVVVDTTCCQTTFNLPAGDEPIFAQGSLWGTAAPLAAGVSLTWLGADAGWVASACMPFNASQNYWFEFIWDAGLPDFGDAGAPIGEDGGPIDVAPIVGHSFRASSMAFVDSDGVPRDLYPALSSCSPDASVP